jgi:hypothetical protein
MAKNFELLLKIQDIFFLHTAVDDKPMIFAMVVPLSGRSNLAGQTL